MELLLWALDKFKHVFWEQVQKLFQQLQNFEGLFMIIVERGRMGDSKVSKNDETSTFWDVKSFRNFEGLFKQNVQN